MGLQYKDFCAILTNA